MRMLPHTAMVLLVAISACARQAPSPTQAPATSAPSPTSAAVRAPDVQADVQAEVDRLVGAGSRGAVAYVMDGDQVWQAAAGTADGTAPMRTDHRFRIASITKTFTAALVLQQVAEGRLALTDRVTRILPGVITTKATVADLLRHTSGIADYLTDERFEKALMSGGHLKYWPPRRLLKYAAKQGTRGYSNTNYILLGMILEKVTRKPYQELLRERVTRPLGLNATELPAKRLPDGLARGEHNGSSGSTEVDASIFWTAGGLVSTAADVALFYRTVFTRPEGRQMREGSFGVDPESLECGGLKVAGHSGMVLGYGGMAMSTEDGKRVVVVQVNSTRPGDAIAAARRLMCGL